MFCLCLYITIPTINKIKAESELVYKYSIFMLLLKKLKADGKDIFKASNLKSSVKSLIHQ